MHIILQVVRVPTCLQEETQLETGMVLEVVVALEALVQVPHTWREVFSSHIVDHLSRDNGAVSASLAGRLVARRAQAGQERRGQVVDHRRQSFVLVQPWQVLGCELPWSAFRQRAQVVRLTSRAFSKRDAKACRTRLIC